VGFTNRWEITKTLYQSLGDYENCLANTHDLNMENVYFEYGDYDTEPFHYGKAQEVFVTVHGMHLLVADTKRQDRTVVKASDKTSEAKVLFFV